MNLVMCREAANDLKARHDRATEILSREKKDLGEKKKLILNIESAQEIAQDVAQAIQSRAYKRISSVVTRCLSSVFDNPYLFRIRFDQKRQKTEAVLLFEREGEQYEDPLNEVGGGPIDIASFALRVAYILCSRPIRRRLLVMDEPFRFVRGKENRQRVRKMLTKLADDLGFQFTLNVDGDAYPEFALGKIIQIGEQ